ncbi:MAG: hypothetical protein ACLULM_06750 [Acutalibacter sp.]
MAGGYFLVLGICWWPLYPDAGAFAGGWGIAFRVLTAAALVVLAWCLSRSTGNRKSREEAEPQKETQTTEGLF